MDNLLQHYQQELAGLHELGAVFAKQYPKIANALGLTATSTSDPHVDRLIEACAFMNARMRTKLEDDFPELSDALLNIIEPDYQAPFPPVLITQLVPKADLTETVDVPRNTVIEACNSDSKVIPFQTCYPVALQPINVVAAKLLASNQTAPILASNKTAVAVLKLVLECSSDITFSELKPNNLRFFLQGQNQYTFPLYDLLMNHTQHIAFANSEQDTNVNFLANDALQPCGFTADESILPHCDRTHVAHRLLKEFFHLPQKFLFFELSNLKAQHFCNIGNKLEIYFYLDQLPFHLTKYINAETFALNCTPIINLFSKIAEPITLDHKQTEYPVVADWRYPNDYQIYSLNSVQIINKEGKQESVNPFYGLQHQANESACFWYVKQDAEISDYLLRVPMLALVDLNFDAISYSDKLLRVETWCCNSDSAIQEVMQHENLIFQFASFSAPIAAIQAKTSVTALTHMPIANKARWKLLSHLALNYLSLQNADDNAVMLREMLQLYNINPSHDSAIFIQSIQSVQVKRGTARLLIEKIPTVVQGLQIQVSFDESQLTGGSLFLFGYLLDHFFAQYATLNSFTQIILNTKNASRSLAPRIGDRILI